MKSKTSKQRSGRIGNTDLTYSITVQFNDEYICSAEGYVSKPDNFHENNWGITENLIDNITGNSYPIHISKDRFIFAMGYSDIDALL